MDGLERSAWILAAVVAALEQDTPEAWDVVRAAGVQVPEDAATRSFIGAFAAAPLHQASAYLRSGSAWVSQTDESMLAQGRASAGGAVLFDTVLRSEAPEIAAILDRKPCRMLDVGVGVAAMAIAFCRTFPALTVTGIDVLEQPLRLAREAVAAAGLEDRIELRQQDVGALEEREAYDLIWLPAPFLPTHALTRGLERAQPALRPGGCVVVAHGRFGQDPLRDALLRFRTLAYGGTVLDDAAADELLRRHGFDVVVQPTTPPAAPAMTIGFATEAR